MDKINFVEEKLNGLPWIQYGHEKEFAALRELLFECCDMSNFGVTDNIYLKFDPKTGNILSKGEIQQYTDKGIKLEIMPLTKHHIPMSVFDSGLIHIKKDVENCKKYYLYNLDVSVLYYSVPSQIQLTVEAIIIPN